MFSIFKNVFMGLAAFIGSVFGFGGNPIETHSATATPTPIVEELPTPIPQIIYTPTPTPKPSPRPVLPIPSPTPSPIYTYFPVSPTFTPIPSKSPTPTPTPHYIYIYPPTPTPQIIYITPTPEPIGIVPSTPSPTPTLVSISVGGDGNGSIFFKLSDTSFFIKAITFDVIDKSTGSLYVFRPDEYLILPNYYFISDSTIRRGTSAGPGNLEITENHYTYLPPEPFKITSDGKYYGFFQLSATLCHVDGSKCPVTDVSLVYKITDIDFVDNVELIGLPVQAN